jgi:hypothetical protein
MKPTEMQLGTIYSWLRWIVPKDEAKAAVSWLEKTATRRAVSDEMTRLKSLKDKRLLDAPKCFTGEIWEGFEHE